MSFLHIIQIVNASRLQEYTHRLPPKGCTEGTSLLHISKIQFSFLASYIENWHKHSAIKRCIENTSFSPQACYYVPKTSGGPSNQEDESPKIPRISTLSVQLRRSFHVDPSSDRTGQGHRSRSAGPRRRSHQAFLCAHAFEEPRTAQRLQSGAPGSRCAAAGARRCRACLCSEH